jgi:hypothetical protein
MIKNFYILDKSGNPTPCEDIIAWAKWFEQDPESRRIVARDTFRAADGTDVIVSTVFLGLDHGWGDGPPVLWETMIFGGTGLSEWQERATSREEALANHRLAIAELVDAGIVETG